MDTPKIIVAVSLIILASSCKPSKPATCDCPKNMFTSSKSDTSFHLSNNKTITLCGYIDREAKPITYSEFVLAACGQDTIVAFWGAVATCNIKIQHDTLVVEQIKNLPVGEDLSYAQTVWLIDKIYFVKNALLKTQSVNRGIPKYSDKEIAFLLSSFKTTPPGISDTLMTLANKLFIATISGDNTARQYFKEFKTKFGILDGAYKEEYNELSVMIEEWDRVY